jgi:hypothetical protein
MNDGRIISFRSRTRLSLLEKSFAHKGETQLIDPTHPIHTRSLTSYPTLIVTTQHQIATLQVRHQVDHPAATLEEA